MKAILIVLILAGCGGDIAYISATHIAIAVDACAPHQGLREVRTSQRSRRANELQVIGYCNNGMAFVKTLEVK
jgi:hypothetical protein